MKLCRLTLVFMLCTTISVCAQSGPAPATRSDILEMFRNMHLKQQFESQVLPQLKVKIPAVIHSSINEKFADPSPAQKKKIGEFAERMVSEHFLEIPVDDMVEASLPVYQRYYTHDELVQVNNFLSSPAGQKFVTTGHQVSQETYKLNSAALQKWADRQKAEIDVEIEKFVQALKSEVKPKP